MVLRASVGVVGLVVLLAVFSSGCEDDNLVTGPTPAGVTTGTTVVVPSSTPASSSTLPGSNTGGGGASSGATAVLTDVELQVRQSAGGCWEVLAPGAPRGVTRQDLWFTSTANCGGTGWSIAVRIFASPSALQAASQAPTTAAVTYRSGTVLVRVAPSAPSSIESVVGSVAGLVRVPSPAGSSPEVP